MRAALSIFCCLLVPQLASGAFGAQRPMQPSAAEIQHRMEKLAVLGNVLYVAAHPDDENTRFLAWAAGALHFNAAYLSLTRGDGGQNLIGPEIREELGIIRTQELLAARRIDGAEQYFSRANDFGYSKTAEETLSIWNEDAILSDTVRVIRRLRPDVIVCRFPVDGGGGHGHHTASAQLALRAFSLAADANAYPEQLIEEQLQIWQAHRIVVNTGRWWKTEISADDPGVVAHDVGAYSPLLGTSFNEVAARSRTMHKSQGFGSTGARGEQIEFFEHLAGTVAEDTLFDGVTTDWTRVTDSAAINEQVRALIDSYASSDPSQSLTQLVQLRRALQPRKNTFWGQRKLAEVDQLIQDCAGLYLEAVVGKAWATAGTELPLRLEVIARNTEVCEWVGADCEPIGLALRETQALAKNKRIEQEVPLRVPTQVETSGPYWLQHPGTLGTYRVDKPGLIGTPQNQPAMSVDLHVRIAEETITYTVPIVHKWNDPVQGERYRPFLVAPPAFINIDKSSYLFAGTQAQTVDVVVKAMAPGYKGMLQLSAGAGWTIEPSSMDLAFTTEGEEQRVPVTITPASGAQPCELFARIGDHERSLRQMDYDHIVPQVYLPKASARLVYVDLKRAGDRVAYVAGAGDVVPDALRSVGFTVDELSESQITLENLAQYDAIITGIRMLNVEERVAHFMPTLLEYCKNGGTLVMQYNTAHRLKTDAFAPYPLTLGRERVTEEDSEIRFLAADHPALNFPNRLTMQDFDGWVQERGLYFPSTWDAQYTPILSWNDQGESAKDGSLLVAPYGDGHYVYTGISFFRELPAGVPGAYRLLVNLLSLGNE